MGIFIIVWKFLSANIKMPSIIWLIKLCKLRFGEPNHHSIYLQVGPAVESIAVIASAAPLSTAISCSGVRTIHYCKSNRSTRRSLQLYRQHNQKSGRILLLLDNEPLNSITVALLHPQDLGPEYPSLPLNQYWALQKATAKLIVGHLCLEAFLPVPNDKVCC